MNRRRSTDPLGDTASNLGNAMDELMRHQPSLKVDAIAAVIKVLYIFFSFFFLIHVIYFKYNFTQYLLNLKSKTNNK